MPTDESSKATITRRTAVAAGLAPLLVPRHVLGGPGYQAPSDTLAIAAVGIGGMGRVYLDGCKSEKIVALCDLDWTRPNTAGVFEKFPTAARYRDFRQMFEKEEKNFDALIMAVPDHWHAILLMHAIRMKKHIYCAKPVAHSIGEVRKVRQALLANPKLVTKGSIQDSRTEGASSSTELLRSGVLGPIREVHVWSWHPIYPCNLLRPSEVETPPAGMDWDLWIGPAPFRPYHHSYHPETWRAWWDFGSGDIGDMGCHTFHYYFEELQLGAPKVVYGNSSTRIDVYNTPVDTPETEGYANTVVWEFGARGNLPPLNLYWYDGGIKPPRPAELDHSIAMPREGVLFVGDNGKLLANYYGGTAVRASGLPGGLLLPQSKFKDFQPPPKTLVRVPKEDHYKEWTRCAKEGRPTSLPVTLAAQLTELAQLGTLALRTRKVLEWDSAAMRVTNEASVNQYVEPTYRSPWKLPAL
jgi:predicted dehydrogenase